jgi:hypothetical protein
MKKRGNYRKQFMFVVGSCEHFQVLEFIAT